MSLSKSFFIIINKRYNILRYESYDKDLSKS
jgi:hypothetical protein